MSLALTFFFSVFQQGEGSGIRADLPQAHLVCSTGLSLGEHFTAMLGTPLEKLWDGLGSRILPVCCSILYFLLPASFLPQERANSVLSVPRGVSAPM